MDKWYEELGIENPFTSAEVEGQNEELEKHESWVIAGVKAMCKANHTTVATAALRAAGIARTQVELIMKMSALSRTAPGNDPRTGAPYAMCCILTWFCIALKEGKISLDIELPFIDIPKED